MSVQLRRSNRKRKCTELSKAFQSISDAEKISKESHSSEDESPIPIEERLQCESFRTAHVSLPTSTSKGNYEQEANASENKSSVTAIQNPINFYGKSSRNFSFSEEETTHNAVVPLQNVVKYKRGGNRENRTLLDPNSGPIQKPKKKTAHKQAKGGTKSWLKKNPKKIPTSSFMKKSLLDLFPPQMSNKDESDPKKTPPKRKFFNNSSREKIYQMTTTLFGKQRISAATILNKPASSNNIAVNISHVPMKMPSQANSSLSSKKLARSSKNVQASPHKEMTINKTQLKFNQGDFLDSIDNMLLEKSNMISEDLQSLNCTFDSLVSSDKENDSTCGLMKSNCSTLSVPELQNLHIDSPSPQAFMQHYHYSPPPKDVACEMSDLPVSNINSPSVKPSPASSCMTTGSDVVGSPILSSVPEIMLHSSPLSSTAKSRAAQNQQESAWPIHYSREKENLSKLKSKRSSTRSLLPAFKNLRVKSMDGKDQLIIDAGQNKIGAQMCNDCGMLYNLDSAEDVGLHLKFHSTMITNMRFQGWKKERVVREFKDGRVLLVLPEDPKYALKKVSDVKSIMDANLGFHEKAQPDKYTMQVYFFVMERKIVGCLIAEAIKQAYRVIPTEENEPLTCSTSPEVAVCGVNRIWTLAAKRRCQVASRLIDCMRTRFYFGCEVTIDQIAFSDPTPDGRQFAAKYTSSKNFLVYK